MTSERHPPRAVAVSDEIGDPLVNVTSAPAAPSASGAGAVPLHLQGERLAAQRRAAANPAPRRVAGGPQNPPAIGGVFSSCLNFSDEVTNLVVICTLIGVFLCTVAPLITSLIVSWTSCEGPILVRYHDELLNFRSRERTTWSAALLTATTHYYGPFNGTSEDTRTWSGTPCSTLGGISIALFVLIAVALLLGTVGLVLSILYSIRRYRYERGRRTLMAGEVRDQAELNRRYPPVTGTMVVVGRGLIFSAIVLIVIGLVPWFTSYVLVRCDKVWRLWWWMLWLLRCLGVSVSCVTALQKTLVPYDMCNLDGGPTWVIVALFAYLLTYTAMWSRRGWISMRSQLDPASSIY